MPLLCCSNYAPNRSSASLTGIYYFYSSRKHDGLSFPTRINPGTTPKSKEASAKAWAETAERGARGIRRCFATTNGSATTKYAGYCKEESYLHEPLNRYQLTVRKGLDFDAGVRYHYTNKFSNKVVERYECSMTLHCVMNINSCVLSCRVVNVPLRPNANHTGTCASWGVYQLLTGS